MKKRLLVLVMAALCIFGVAACGNSEFNTGNGIAAVNRETGSGTRSAFEDLVMGDVSFAQGIAEQSSTPAILQYVGKNKYSIAYESLGYVDSTVKALSVDGVTASAANVKDGSYKLQRPFVIILRKGMTAETLTELEKEFYTYMLSTEAASVIEANGYVAVDGQTQSYTTTGLTGNLVLWGSTSVQPLMEKLRDDFRKGNPGVTFTIDGNGSGEGRKVGDGSDTNNANFGMASSDIETKHNIEKDCYFTLCKDGIAMIVNNDNPTANITMSQLQAIYSGSVKKWSEVIA